MRKSAQFGIGVESITDRQAGRKTSTWRPDKMARLSTGDDNVRTLKSCGEAPLTAWSLGRSGKSRNVGSGPVAVMRLGGKVQRRHVCKLQMTKLATRVAMDRTRGMKGLGSYREGKVANG